MFKMLKQVLFDFTKIIAKNDARKESFALQKPEMFLLFSFFKIVLFSLNEFELFIHLIKSPQEMVYQLFICPRKEYLVYMGYF